MGRFLFDALVLTGLACGVMTVATLFTDPLGALLGGIACIFIGTFIGKQASLD